MKGFIEKYIKAKDTPWDAVPKGSVACTVDANVVDNSFKKNQIQKESKFQKRKFQIPTS